MSDTTLTVDPRIFPVPIVQSALYALSERIGSQIQIQEDGQLYLTLHALVVGLDGAKIRQELDAALLTASVNEWAFQKAAPIRNYLAQTAFSITTENQQTIEEFAAGLGNERASEHAGAPSTHINFQATDETANLTPAGNRLTVEQENGRVLFWSDPRKHLLPDTLWAAHELRDACTCEISHGPHGQLFVLLTPHDARTDLRLLGQRFEHWLGIAGERRV